MKIHRNKSIAATGLFLVFAVLGWGAPLVSAGWHIETADAIGGGKFSSLRIDKFGNGHVAYYDESRHELNYGFWDHKLNKWFTTTLDDNVGGFCSLALDSKQYPHISYLEYGHGKIKYIRWDGSSWHKQTLEIKAKNISFYTSIALDANDNPHISYYEYWGTGENYELALRTIGWTGDHWEVMTIDATPGSGKFNSMATASTGLSQIAYANVKSENAGLRYAAWNGTSWTVTVLEGVAEPHPVYSVALVLDDRDAPHIAFTDLTDNIVKYATRNAGKWEIQSIDSVAEPAYPDRNGIAVDSERNPYVSYFDARTGVLKLAHRTNGKWTSEVVDENFNGFTSSLQIAQGRIWLTYSDESGQRLRFAYRSLDSGDPANQPVSSLRKRE